MTDFMATYSPASWVFGALLLMVGGAAVFALVAWARERQVRRICRDLAHMGCTGGFPRGDGGTVF